MSRALRGRPFDHEDYMETLYPDVIGSGGAPKRIMKPKRRDGQPGDDSELAGANTSILSIDQAVTGQQSGLESPVTQPALHASSSQPGTTTPPAALISTPAQGSALTPPEDTAVTNKKRSLASADLETSLSASDTPSRPDASQVGSPEKRIRFSASEDAAVHPSTAASANLPTPHATRYRDSLDTTTDTGHMRGVQEDLVPCAAGAGAGSGLWREKAVDLFYRDFSAEELDLQVKIPQELLSNEHTAMVFCKMPCQVREHWVRSLRGASR